MTLPPHSSSSTWLMSRMAGRFASYCLTHTHFLTGFSLVHRSSHCNTGCQALSYWGELEPVIIIAIIALVFGLYKIFFWLMVSQSFVLLYRFVMIRKHQTIQKHMSRLREKPRLYEVDPDCLVWTPARSLYRKPSEMQHRIGAEVNISLVASFFCIFYLFLLYKCQLLGV